MNKKKTYSIFCLFMALGSVGYGMESSQDTEHRCVGISSVGGIGTVLGESEGAAGADCSATGINRLENLPSAVLARLTGYLSFRDLQNLFSSSIEFRWKIAPDLFLEGTFVDLSVCSKNQNLLFVDHNIRTGISPLHMLTRLVRTLPTNKVFFLPPVMSLPPALKEDLEKFEILHQSPFNIKGEAIDDLMLIATQGYRFFFRGENSVEAKAGSADDKRVVPAFKEFEKVQGKKHFWLKDLFSKGSVDARVGAGGSGESSSTVCEKLLLPSVPKGVTPHIVLMPEELTPPVRKFFQVHPSYVPMIDLQGDSPFIDDARALNIHALLDHLALPKHVPVIVMREGVIKSFKERTVSFKGAMPPDLGINFSRGLQLFELRGKEPEPGSKFGLLGEKDGGPLLTTDANSIIAIVNQACVNTLNGRGAFCYSILPKFLKLTESEGQDPDSSAVLVANILSVSDLYSHHVTAAIRCIGLIDTGGVSPCRTIDIALRILGWRNLEKYHAGAAARSVGLIGVEGVHPTTSVMLACKILDKVWVHRYHDEAAARGVGLIGVEGADPDLSAALAGNILQNQALVEYHDVVAARGVRLISIADLNSAQLAYSILRDTALNNYHAEAAERGVGLLDNTRLYSSRRISLAIEILRNSALTEHHAAAAARSVGLIDDRSVGLSAALSELILSNPGLAEHHAAALRRLD